MNSVAVIAATSILLVTGTLVYFGYFGNFNFLCIPIPFVNPVCGSNAPYAALPFFAAVPFVIFFGMREGQHHGG